MHHANESDTMPDFIPSLTLNGLFYDEFLRGWMARTYPDVVYSCAKVGPGSEVLGYDTAMSADHHWGITLSLYLTATDHAQVGEEIRERLRHDLPTEFRGTGLNYRFPPEEPHIGILMPVSEGPVTHLIGVRIMPDDWSAYLGVDDVTRTFTPLEWLNIPQQKLLTLTAGRVYHDGLNLLEPLRVMLAYYPQDVWLYLLAAQWQRIGQEEPFVGRSGSVGDALGSRVIAGRLARDVMLLCFLLERRYAPYAKWFGTAFARLDCAPQVMPHLHASLAAETWAAREAGLAHAYEICAQLQNQLGICPPVPDKTSSFHGRPFQVIHGEAISAVVHAAIQDEAVKNLPLVGSIDQISDNVDFIGQHKIQLSSIT